MVLLTGKSKWSFTGEVMLKNKKGFTLVELIISIAIISILVVSFLPLFSTSFKWIADAGRKSDALFNSQDVSEEKILQGADTNSDNLNFNFTYSDGSGSVNVNMDGEYVQNGTIHMFVPNK